MPRKSGAACAINHRSLFNKEGPASHTRRRAFLLLDRMLKNHRPLRAVAERAVVTHIYEQLLLDHKNLATDMSRM